MSVDKPYRNSRTQKQGLNWKKKKVIWNKSAYYLEFCNVSLWWTPSLYASEHMIRCRTTENPANSESFLILMSGSPCCSLEKMASNFCGLTASHDTWALENLKLQRQIIIRLDLDSRKHLL